MVIIEGWSLRSFQPYVEPLKKKKKNSPSVFLIFHLTILFFQLDFFDPSTGEIDTTLALIEQIQEEMKAEGESYYF